MDFFGNKWLKTEKTILIFGKKCLSHFRKPRFYFFSNFSVGATTNFSTNYSNWLELFPGIRPKLTTLNVNLLMPIIREILLGFGTSSATSNALRTLLSQSTDPANKSNCDGYTSNMVGLILGGVEELRAFLPNTYKCVIAKRRGFVRIALETGASLVPAISFGENSIYETVDLSGPIGRRIKHFCKQYFNINLVIPNGRGIFQENFGPIPTKHPITTVIGAPIPVKKNPNPSTVEIERIHKLFCIRLIELFERNKSKYVENYEHVHLEIIWLWTTCCEIKRMLWHWILVKCVHVVNFIRI